MSRERHVIHRSICWSCKNSSGKRYTVTRCPWIYENKPVEGWTAIECELDKSRSYNVYSCPLFAPKAGNHPYRKAEDMNTDGANLLIENIVRFAIDDLRAAYQAEESVSGYAKLTRSFHFTNTPLKNGKIDIVRVKKIIGEIESFFLRGCNGMIDEEVSKRILRELQTERDRRRERTGCKLLNCGSMENLLEKADQDSPGEDMHIRRRQHRYMKRRCVKDLMHLE